MKRSTALTCSLALACVTILGLAKHARAQGDSKVQAVVYADTSSVGPGKPFWIGVKFTIEPGWHIYWQNPGDSGLATQLKLTLPDGFTAGEVRFPIPQRLVQAGDVVNYGYENEVMLLVQITPPKELATGRMIKLSGRATWLVCKEDCMPGSADLSLQLPAGDAMETANADLFSRWTQLLPQKADSNMIDSNTVSTKLVDGSGSETISVKWKNPVSAALDVQFIPGMMKTGDIADIKISNSESSSVITFSIKNKKDPEAVSGLVTYSRADGSKGAIEIATPATVSPHSILDK